MQEHYIYRELSLHVKFNKLIFRHNCVNRNNTTLCTIPYHIHLFIILSVFLLMFACEGAVVLLYVWIRSEPKMFDIIAMSHKPVRSIWCTCFYFSILNYTLKWIKMKWRNRYLRDCRTAGTWMFSTFIEHLYEIFYLRPSIL